MTSAKRAAETELPPVYFKFAGRLARLLGQESVSDPGVAVLELIKNAYDADATEAVVELSGVRAGGGTLTVKDNGTGMSLGDIEKNWMTVATDDKTRQPLTKKFQRRKIGEKGVGRFATENLGTQVEILSKPAGETTGYRLVIDWTAYEGQNAFFDKVANKLFEFQKTKSQRGLEIWISGLRHRWDENRVKALRRDISMILPPAGAKRDFSVRMVCEEFPEHAGQIKSTFLKQADFSLTGRLEKSGKITYRMKARNGQERKASDTMKEFACGPLEFQLYFYYVGATKYAPRREQRHYKVVREILQDYGGIKLYRDSFRVKPFGDAGNDWLELNQDRVNSPTLYPSNNQIFGFVRISKDRNPAIIDTTTREGIVHNAAYQDLVRFVKGSLRWFSTTRAEVEGKPKKSKKKGTGGIKASFRKLKSTKPPTIVPDEVAIGLPTGLLPILTEATGCLAHEYHTAAAVMMRKALESGLDMKFRQEGCADLLHDINGDPVELPKRIEFARQKGFITANLARRLVKIKLFGDTAAHSYRIQIYEEDTESMKDILRLTLEDLKLRRPGRNRADRE